MPMAFHVYGSSHLATPGKKWITLSFLKLIWKHAHLTIYYSVPPTHATQATVMYVNLMHYAL